MTTELIKRARSVQSTCAQYVAGSDLIRDMADALEAMQRELESWQKATAEIENKWIESCDRLVEAQRELAAQAEALKLAKDAIEFAVKPICQCWAGCPECDPSGHPTLLEALAAINALEK